MKPEAKITSLQHADSLHTSAVIQMCSPQHGLFCTNGQIVGFLDEHGSAPTQPYHRTLKRGACPTKKEAMSLEKKCLLIRAG